MKLRIAEVRAERGLSQQKVADALGMHLVTYSNLENGKNKRGVGLKRLFEIAEILKARPEELIARLPRRAVQVRGVVQAGHFAEATEWPEEDRYEIALGDVDETAPLFAVETRGPSMNRVYPEGTILICIDFRRAPEKLQFGKRYIVERIRADGLHEMTVKTVSRDSDGKLWLIPESNDPRFTEAFPVEGQEGDEIHIVGRVRYSQRPE